MEYDSDSNWFSAETCWEIKRVSVCDGGDVLFCARCVRKIQVAANFLTVSDLQHFIHG